MNLGDSLGQMSITPVDTAVGVEVSIHTFGAVGVGMVTLLAFLICGEHFFLNASFVLCVLLLYTLVNLQLVEEVYLNCKIVH